MEVFVAIISLVLICGGLIGWFVLLNKTSGERYIRRQLQGPYVPLSKEPHDDEAASSQSCDNM